jgi:hypothetical protein
VKWWIVVVSFGIAVFPGIATFPAEAQLTCSPAPCVTENISVSSTAPGTTVAGMVLAASPGSQSLAITANDFFDMKYCFGSIGDSSESAVFTSSDLGLTWSGGCQPPSGPNFGPNFDPIAGYDNAGDLFSGQLGVSNSGETVFLQKLGAGSSIWGNYFPSLEYTDQSTVDFFDYDFPGMAIDNNHAAPVLYVTAWEKGLRGLGAELVSAVAVGQSYDGGATWSTERVSDILTGTNLALYSRIAVAENSKILATWIQTNGGSGEVVYAALSSNHGALWTTPAKAFEIFQTPQAGAQCIGNYPGVVRTVPNTCVRMYYFSQLASSYTSAGLNQFNAVYPNFNGTNVAIEYRATQNGTKWSAPIVLSSVAADQFEPCIATASNNSSTLGVAWLDTRNSPVGQPDTLYDAYGVVSTDGGLTWSSPYRLTPESGATMVQTEPQSQYLGDWTGCAWANGILYYAFPSTANGTNQVATIVGLNP